MNQKDYYHHINQNIHNLLKTLYDCPPKTNEKEINQLTKKYLEIGFIASFSFEAHQEIFNCARILKQNVVKMDSFSGAQKELAGAINGLNILLKHETDQEKQILIKQELREVGQYGQSIEDIFLIKEALDHDPQLIKEIYHDSKFMQDFGMLRTLYGRKRNIHLSVVRSLVQAYFHPEIYSILKEFSQAIFYAREANLAKLQEGQIPSIQEIHNEKLIDLHTQLTLVGVDLEKDFKNFKEFIDELIDRSLIRNTQIHEDGLDLAFNSVTESVTAERIKDVIGATVKNRQERLNQLITASQEDEVNRKSIEKEIEILQSLEGYYHKMNFIYTKSIWDPVIGPNDPIKPLYRIIGFATEEGKRKESRSLLDFSQILKQDLNLSVAERQVLSQLLKQCSMIIIENPTFLQKWNENQEFSKEIDQLLTLFDHEELPLLKILTLDQKMALILEALTFTFDVYYQLNNNLLNL